MTDFIPTMCGDNDLYIPDSDCTECDELKERIDKLEECCDEVKSELEKKLEATDITGDNGITVTIDEETGKPVISTSKEQLLNVLGYDEIELSKTDSEGQTVIAHVLGYIEIAQQFKWDGLDDLTVNTNEEFDPMDSVSVIGCNDQPATIELLSPTINGVSDWTVPLNGTFNPLYGVTATGIEGEDLTDNLHIIGEDDIDVPGTYTITYAVTDGNGNHAEEQATIIVLSDEQITTSFKVIATDTFNTEEIQVFLVDENGEQVVSQDNNGFSQVVTIPSLDAETVATITTTGAVHSLPTGVGMYDCYGDFHTDTLDGTPDYDTSDCVVANIVIDNTATPYTITISAIPDEESEGE